MTNAQKIIKTRHAFGRMKTTSKWVPVRTPWGTRMEGFICFMPTVMVSVKNASGTRFHWTPSTWSVTAPTWE